MAKILHRIIAYLYENFLTANPNDYAARVASERTLGIRQICESAVSRGGATTPAAAMQHAVNEFLKEMAYLLCDGYAVNAEYFTVSPSIRGVFDSPNEQFNPRKHSLLFQFNQGEKLRKELSTVEVRIMGVADSGIGIVQVTDMKSGSVNDLLTPNRTLKITGNKLKIAGDSPSVGVYFVNSETGERFAVEPSDMVINNPSELIVTIPELTAGTYTVEVTSQFGGTVPLKEPRTAVFGKLLTVS